MTHDEIVTLIQKTNGCTLVEARFYLHRAIGAEYLTKRDFISAMAMQGILANHSLGEQETELISKWSIEHAECLLKYSGETKVEKYYLSRDLVEAAKATIKSLSLKDSMAQPAALKRLEAVLIDIGELS